MSLSLVLLKFTITFLIAKAICGSEPFDMCFYFVVFPFLISKEDAWNDLLVQTSVFVIWLLAFKKLIGNRKEPNWKTFIVGFFLFIFFKFAQLWIENFIS